MKRTDKYDAGSNRYYAFNPRIGRKRIPQDHSITVEDAIAFAVAIGADNVVLEIGPPSRPIGSSFVWKKETV